MQEKIVLQLQQVLEEMRQSGEWPSFDMPEIRVEYPKNEAFGDYTTNLPLVLGKMLKRDPMEIAQVLESRITNPKSPVGDLESPLRDQESSLEGVDLEKIEAAHPGFLNFTLSRKYFQKVVGDIIKQGEQFGQGSIHEETMVEYSQPNTHKEFHIGHLRNVFIGGTLVNVLRKSGQEVIAANYIGDTGTHIAKCLWGLVTFHADDDLDIVENKGEFLGKVYSEAAQKIAGNIEYGAAFRALQKKFETGDPELMALWKKTRQWSLDEFETIYRQLGVVFDEYFYESVEEAEGKKLLPKLLAQGIIKESQGAIIADLEEYGLGVLVLVRQDGSPLYGLKDIPLAKKKFEKYGINRSIYVVDIRQSLYLQQIFKILELYGFHKKLSHVGYEFVALKGGESMSSRKGNIIPARELIERVTAKIKEKFPESPDPAGIAQGAIRFAMLKHSAASKIEFDIDESVKLEGATGPYVQYAHARIASVLRKAEEAGLSFDHNAGASILEHPKELALMRELDKFPDLIAEVAETYAVHKLPHYAIRLADKFHSFYDECRVIDEAAPDITAARLQLVRAVQIVLGETLRLIGVSAPEKM